MNFRRGSQTEELEINFIPLIDVLLVIIIFLVVSTTFSKFSELKINLPTAEASPQDKDLDRIDIVVTADNQFIINNKKLSENSINEISKELHLVRKGGAHDETGVTRRVSEVHQATLAQHQDATTVRHNPLVDLRLDFHPSCTGK